jgi:hypothetical protein
MDQSVAIELWALGTGLGQLVLLEVAPDDLRGGHVAHTTPHLAMMLLAAILSDTVILSSPTTTERDRVRWSARTRLPLRLPDRRCHASSSRLS